MRGREDETTTGKQKKTATGAPPPPMDGWRPGETARRGLKALERRWRRDHGELAEEEKIVSSKCKSQSVCIHSFSHTRSHLPYRASFVVNSCWDRIPAEKQTADQTVSGVDCVSQ